MVHTRVIHLPFAEDAIYVAIGVIVEWKACQIPSLAFLCKVVELLGEELPLTTVVCFSMMANAQLLGWPFLWFCLARVSHRFHRFMHSDLIRRRQWLQYLILSDIVAARNSVRLADWASQGSQSTKWVPTAALLMFGQLFCISDLIGYCSHALYLLHGWWTLGSNSFRCHL